MLRRRRPMLARIEVVLGAGAFALLACLALLAAPAPAIAHAELLLADPAPGTGLPQAPGSIVLKFSEPLDLGLSRIAVLDAGGHDVGSGGTQPVPGDPSAMQRKLGLLPAGGYSVAWTSVSEIDGHTLTGRYSFAVGAAADSAQTVDEDPLGSGGPLGFAGRLAAFIGLALWAGWALLRRMVTVAALDARRVRRIGLAAPALAAAGTAVGLAGTSLAATGGLEAVGAAAATTSGQWDIVVTVAAVLGLLLLAARRAWPSALLAAIALVAEAASGHAAATPLPVVGVVIGAVHLASAGAWTFAIGAAVLASTDLPRTLRALTPYAVAAAGMTGLTGIANAAFELTSPADLVAGPYGFALIAKALAFGAMAAFGLVHYLRNHRPGSAAAPPGLRSLARSELVAALAAILIATGLAGFPNPPRVQAEEVTVPTIDPVLQGLDATSDALALAAPAGPYVVGLSVLPARPGPIRLRVQVLGVEAADGLRQAEVQVSRDGGGPPQLVLLVSCGLGCFAGQTELSVAGTWHFAVGITSNRGPVELDLQAPLPAPDGSAELARAVASMEALRSAHLVETLHGQLGGPEIRAVYDFQAPDSMAIDVGDSQRIIIGAREWDRTDASGRWQAQAFPAPGFAWPSGYYAGYWIRPAAVHLIGNATVDGVPSHIVAFMRPNLPAWFRLWVGDADGLVRRQEMLAEGHIMEDTYTAFDAAAPIASPAP